MRFLREHPAIGIPRALPDLSEPETAATELARRLKEDPLNIELHRAYWPLRHLLKKSAEKTLPAPGGPSAE
jgi:hypothetical protein